MRFYRPKDGDTRVRTFFAIFPVRCNNEIRWLEMVSVSEKFSNHGYWIYMNFIDDVRKSNADNNIN